MYKRIKQSFATAIFFEVAIVIILSVGMLGYLWINKEYESFNFNEGRGYYFIDSLEGTLFCIPFCLKVKVPI